MNTIPNQSIRLRCKNGDHKGPIQAWTETCLHCGWNQYVTNEEYEKWLDAQLKETVIEDKEDRLRKKWTGG